MSSTGRTILITGGAQGIGKGMVRYFSSRGWQVGFVDEDRAAGEQTASQFTGTRFVPGDVTESGLAERVVRDVLTEFGHLDALVNNAGVGRFVPIEELSVEDFRRVLEINLVAAFAWSKAAAGALRASKGAIVNIASTRALQSEPHGEAYGASKGGILALTHALAVSLGPEIRVNAVSPGWIEVGQWQKAGCERAVDHSDADRLQHPVGRVGEVDDIASMVAFLCGAESGFITGQNHVIDGGMTKKMIYV